MQKQNLLETNQSTGFINQADVEPVIAKTINIIASWNWIQSQRFFNAFIFYL
jgi:hypothetical protein